MGVGLSYSENEENCVISRLESKRWQAPERSPLPSIVSEKLPGTSIVKGYVLLQRVFHGPRVVREPSLIAWVVLREVEKWSRESQTWRDPSLVQGMLKM